MQVSSKFKEKKKKIVYHNNRQTHKNPQKTNYFCENEEQAKLFIINDQISLATFHLLHHPSKAKNYQLRWALLRNKEK